MILRLVWRSLVRRPGRSALLLLGYALGVGVTIVLLSIGGALLEQARDRQLVGGGDLTVLPAGLDLETFRTGGVSSLYFTIEQAPFLHRQVLEGPRFDDRIRAAAPWIDDELVYVRTPGSDGATAASGGGQIPSRAAALGVAPQLTAGSWEDATADRAWAEPSDSLLYASMDAFHLPSGTAAGDSTWAEWHYFNVLLPGDAGWLYLTFMVAGEVPDGRWGGRILATLVEPDILPPPDRPPVVASAGTERSWTVSVPPEDVTFHLDRPDLRMGPGDVHLTPEGRYRLRASLPAEGGDALRLELTLRPSGRRYLPALEIAPGDVASGYTVPLLDGRASGRICVDGACRRVRDARAYHDHNWGVWRDVTWDWGQAAAAGRRSVLYGGLGGPGAPGGARFLFLADSLGFAGLLPVERIDIRWDASSGPAGRVVPGRDPAVGRGAGRTPVPLRLGVEAASGDDRVVLDVDVRHARVTEAVGARGAPGAARLFYQLHGQARLGGRLRNDTLKGRGAGFFETWRVSAAGDTTGGP